MSAVGGSCACQRLRRWAHSLREPRCPRAAAACRRTGVRGRHESGCRAPRPGRSVHHGGCPLLDDPPLSWAERWRLAALERCGGLPQRKPGAGQHLPDKRRNVRSADAGVARARHTRLRLASIDLGLLAIGFVRGRTPWSSRHRATHSQRNPAHDFPLLLTPSAAGLAAVGTFRRRPGASGRRSLESRPSPTASVDAPPTAT